MREWYWWRGCFLELFSSGWFPRPNLLLSHLSTPVSQASSRKSPCFIVLQTTDVIINPQKSQYSTRKTTQIFVCCPFKMPPWSNLLLYEATRYLTSSGFNSKSQFARQDANQTRKDGDVFHVTWSIPRSKFLHESAVCTYPLEEKGTSSDASPRILLDTMM